MNNVRTSFKGAIFLTITAIIWGMAFVAQSMGMEHLGPVSFNGIRFLIGVIVLLPIIIFRNMYKKKKGTVEKSSFKSIAIASICTGGVIFVASTLQQIGLIYTTAGKAGFITAMYIVIVPILGILIKRKTLLLTWFAVIIAIVGMYLLCVDGEFSIATGDIFVLAGSLFWAIHILVVDHFSKKVECLELACGQFLVAGFISLPIMLLFEDISVSALYDCALPLAYAGILSCGVAYTFQLFGQKYTAPALASLIMSLESVFAVLGGFLILHEKLTQRELAGCALILFAVIMAQVVPEIIGAKCKKSG